MTKVPLGTVIVLITLFVILVTQTEGRFPAQAKSGFYNKCALMTVCVICVTKLLCIFQEVPACPAMGHMGHHERKPQLF